MNIDWYKPLIHSLENSSDLVWVNKFSSYLENILNNPKHGHFPQWNKAYEDILENRSHHYNFSRDVIEIGHADELDSNEKDQLHHCLTELIPWRKGPFNFFGTPLDAEWRSDFKWSRILPLLPELKNKKILDVGCGNGYYMLRMLGAGASQVIGVDPNLLYLSQFYSIKKLLKNSIDAHLLPIPFEDLPVEFNFFDCVFSMGVLYHRRDPLEHLQCLYQHTKPWGHVLLETLIIDADDIQEIIPKDRYAGMRNVWSIPSAPLVIQWLEQSGFRNCKLLDQDKTSLTEQRSTQWMPNHSLANFLDSHDADKTIEGYPAPLRAIFSAQVVD